MSPPDLTTEVPLADASRQLLVERAGLEARVRARLRDVGRAAISGPPRVGKTTLCLRVLRWWEREEGSAPRRAVKIGLERDHIDWRHFSTELIAKLRDGLDMPPRRRSSEGQRSLKAELLEIVRAGGPLLMAIDELNELLSSAARTHDEGALRRAAARELLSALHEVQTTVTHRQLAFLLSGSVEPADVLPVADSPVAQIEAEPIDDFDAEDAAAFLRALEGVPRAEMWLTSLRDGLGGHPMLLQEALIRLRRGELGDPADAGIENAVGQYARRLRGELGDPPSIVMELVVDAVRKFPAAERVQLLADYGETLERDGAVLADGARARRLRNVGLVELRYRGTESIEVRPRSPLFRAAFDEGWVLSRLRETARPYAAEATEWHRKGRPDAALPENLDRVLAALEPIVDSLSDVEGAFLVAASRRLARTQRNRVVAAIGILVPVLIGVVAFAVYTSNQAREAAAENARLQALIGRSDTASALATVAGELEESGILARASPVDRARLVAVVETARAAAVALGQQADHLRTVRQARDQALARAAELEREVAQLEEEVAARASERDRAQARVQEITRERDRLVRELDIARDDLRDQRTLHEAAEERARRELVIARAAHADAERQLRETDQRLADAEDRIEDLELQIARMRGR